MAIINIRRDSWGDPSIVRLITTDSYAQMLIPGYLTANEPSISAVNGGDFQWAFTDVILAYFNTGWAFFTISADFTTLTPFFIDVNNFQWIDVTSTPKQMLSNNGYVADSSSLVSLALPVTAKFGDIVSIEGKGSGGWTITQGAGQSITIAPLTSTVGVGGSVSSTDTHNSISLVCIVANLTWTTYIPPQGTLTII